MLNRFLQLIIILSIASLIYSCDDYCEMTDYESYLPLKLGNKWYYGENETREVIGKSVFNGKEFSDVEIKIENFNGDLLTYHIYYYFEDSKLYKYANDDKIEVLLADFSLNKGDKFEQSNTGFIVKVTSDDQSKFTFEYDQPEWGDEEYAITFGVDKGILSECSLAWGSCTELADYELK